MTFVTTSRHRHHHVVLLGDSGVGKTSLVRRLTNPDEPFNADTTPTVGIEFETVHMDLPQGGKATAQIWDTAGQERFAKLLVPVYFRKAKGAILVYDITSAKSFESISERWMEQLNEHRKDGLAKLLVGNKSDLLSSERQVSKEQVKKFCEEHGMESIETSAKLGDNVSLAFEKLVGIVHEESIEEESKKKKKNKRSNSIGSMGSFSGVTGINNSARSRSGASATSALDLNDLDAAEESDVADTKSGCAC